MNTHVVLKRIPGTSYEPGTEVDASEWRNAMLLVDQRYLKPLNGVEAPALFSAESEIDLRASVTDIVLQDIRENGPIARALKSAALIPHEVATPRNLRKKGEQA